MAESTHSKRRRWPVFLALLLVVLLAAGMGLGQVVKSRQAAQASQLASAKVTRGPIALTVYGSGSIEAGKTVPIFAPAAALVDQVHVEKGDQVKKGDILAVLTSDSLAGEISKLEDTIKALDQQISQTRQATGSATITAPAAGRLMIIHAAVGQPVNAVMDQYDALGVISADGHLKVEWQGITALQPGDPVVVRVGDQSAAGLVVRQLNGEHTAELPDDTLEPGQEAAILDQDGHQAGRGILEINKPVYVTADGGIIKSVSRQAGDKVSKGSKLFTLEEAALASAYRQLIDDRAQALADLQAARGQQALLTVTAPSDGIVSQLSLTEKGQIQKNQLVCTLADVSSFKMLMQIDELDIASVSIGQTAALKLAAADYQSFPATVSRISVIGTTTGGVTTYPVTLTIEPAANILAGMSASADILVADKKDVLTIPLEALKVDGSRTYVTLVQRDSAGVAGILDRDVTVGLANGTLAEILAGLNEGDEVLTTDTAQDGLAGGAFGISGFRQMRTGG